jgi:hypothetical protein
VQIDPTQLGTLELSGQWIPYVDLYDVDFLPTRLNLGSAEYAFDSSIIRLGHGAVLPQKIRDVRSAGKKPLIVEREDRYYLYVTPP